MSANRPMTAQEIRTVERNAERADQVVAHGNKLGPSHWAASYSRDVTDLIDEVSRLKAENDVMRSALSQYAKPVNWFDATHVNADGFKVSCWAWDDHRVPWSVAAYALSGDHLAGANDGAEEAARR